MPPKKKEEAPKEKPILGRFSSHLKMGIVGMPNVGKSSTFVTLYCSHGSDIPGFGTFLFLF